MKVEIKDAKLVDILKKRAVLHGAITKVNEVIVNADKERTKLGYKMDALKEKTKVIMDKLSPKLEEFEIISRVYLEKGKAYYDVDNLVELYKEALREKKQAETNEANENTTN